MEASEVGVSHRPGDGEPGLAKWVQGGLSTWPESGSNPENGRPNQGFELVRARRTPSGHVFFRGASYTLTGLETQDLVNLDPDVCLTQFGRHERRSRCAPYHFERPRKGFASRSKADLAGSLLLYRSLW